MFSSKYVVAALDYATKRLVRLQTFFAVFSILLLTIGTFLSPIVNVFAVDQDTAEIVESTPETDDKDKLIYADIHPSEIPIDKEEISLRSTNEKVFRKKDGTYELTLYPNDIHYYDDGLYKEIDNTLVSKSINSYSNTQNAFDIEFPKSLNEFSTIQLSKDEYSIDWRVVNTSKSISKINNASINVEAFDTYNPKSISMLDSSIIYPNVFPNTDLEYHLTGLSIKEYLYINKNSGQPRFTFHYSFENLQLKTDENNMISLVNNLGENVFKFEKLYMFDADNNVSYDIELEVNELSSNSFELSIIPSSEWLLNAVYPVTIDPTIHIVSSSNTYEDTYINASSPTTSYTSSDTMKIGGTNSNNETRGLLYFNIPSNLMDKQMLYSHLILTRKTTPSTGFQVNMHKNYSRYVSNVSWNTAPEFDDNVVDYYTVGYDRSMQFDISKPIQEWQQAGISQIPGFTLIADDLGSVLDTYQKHTSYPDQAPVVTFGFEDRTGLKEYWTYNAQELGEAGTGYVTDYTGTLTWVRNEYALKNEFLSLNLSFYHNYRDRAINIGYGNGWKTNFNMEVLLDSDGITRYLVKPDGSNVYFIKISSESYYGGYIVDTYLAEDGSRMKLTITYYVGQVYSSIIKTVNDITHTFDKSGRLTKITDSKTNHDLFIYYTSNSKRVSYVKDEAGNRIDFTYTNNILTKTALKLIQSPTTYNTVHEKNYFYSSTSRLDRIEQTLNYSAQQGSVSGPTIEYSFSTANKLTQVYSTSNNLRINYSYTANRVTHIQTIDVEGASQQKVSDVDIVYGSGNTTYTNQSGQSVKYTFDIYGHTINVLDSFGNSSYYKYAGIFAYPNNNSYLDESEIINLPPNYYINHKLIESSDVMKQHSNLIDNHGFENESSLKWTMKSGSDGIVTKSSEEKLMGNYALKVTKVSIDNYAQQSQYLTAGQYTISGWIKNASTSAISFINVNYGTTNHYSNTVSAVGEWIYASVTFNLTTAQTVNIRLSNYMTNTTAYFDNIQLNKGFQDTRYNALSNGSFEDGTTGWSVNGASIAQNSEAGIINEILGSKSMKIIGDGSVQYSFSQNITSLLKTGETYIVGGWAKANAVPNKAFDYTPDPNIIYPLSDNRFFGLYIMILCPPDGINYTTPYYKHIYLPFNSSVTDWQYQMRSFTVPNQVTSITMYGIFRGEGTAYFDNIQLYRDNLSTNYNYYNNGDLKNKTTSAGKLTEYGYDGNNHLTSITEGTKSIDIDYSSSYLVEEISRNNVKSTFVYDSSSKQLLETHFGQQGAGYSWFKTSTSYTTDRQYITGKTDEFGNTISYEVNQLTGLLELIEDAKGNSTQYIYNEYGEIVEQINTDQENYNSIHKEFIYDANHRLIGIEIEDMSYGLVYDQLDRISEVIVAGNDYVNLSYVQKGEYYTSLIESQTYANNDSYYFTYTDENQIKQIKFGNDIWYEYTYDQSGRVTIYKDIPSSHIYFYTYDLLGRIKQVSDENNNKINYTYDPDGNLNSYEYQLFGTNKKVNYHYNEVTGEYDYTYYNTGTKSVYEYYDIDEADSLKRLNSINLKIGSVNLYKYFGYETPSNSTNGNTSLMVGQIIYIQPSGTLIHQFEYDENKNIIKIEIKQGSTLKAQYDYVYDGFNQLTRENIWVQNGTQRTKTYTYDLRGNITAIREYNYTTGTINGTPLNHKELYYLTNNWLDQIDYIKYYTNGTLVKTSYYEYDEIGNVLSVSGSNEVFTWDGRRLKTHTIGSITYTYIYNDQGVRIQKSNGTTTTEYVVDGYNVLAEKTGSTVIYYTYKQDGNLLSIKVGNNEYFYITNLQGDIIELVDISGNTVAKYTYDAWGNHQVLDSLGNPTSNPDFIGNINPYRYRSYRYDKDTGLYYLNSRYYNPQIGRFISADSISYLDPSSETGLNLYTYCGNNPVMYVDPSGEFFLSIALISSILIGVAKILITAAVTYAVVKTVEVIVNAIEYADNEQKKDSWTVYVLIDSAGVIQYVGRTQNITARRNWHHNTRLGLKFVEKHTNLTYAEARGLEQMYMIQYDTVHKGSFMNNQINGISPNNPRAGEYFLAGLKKLDNQIENALLNLFGG